MIRSRLSVLLLAAFAWAVAGEVSSAPAADSPSTPAASPPQANAPADAAKAAPGGSATPTDVTANLQRAFNELADPRADVREAARSTLMSLERRYLDDLRKLVERSRPLRPAQATALRQIVTHVYLSGLPYEPEPGVGFLGVRAQQIAISSGDEPPAGNGGPLPDDTGGGGAEGGDNAAPVGVPRIGMVVVYRLPGFVGHRALLDGDVILGIVEQPDVSFAVRDAFTNAIKQLKAGETFHLNVLRRGRVMKLELTLDRRPAAVNNDLAGEAFDRDRRMKVDAYWRESFAPLLPETLE